MPGEDVRSLRTVAIANNDGGKMGLVVVGERGQAEIPGAMLGNVDLSHRLSGTTLKHACQYITQVAVERSCWLHLPKQSSFE